MTYFNYLLSNQGSNDKDKIVGTCYTYCPQEEICLRKQEKLVHILEVVDDDMKLIKSYSRSAAASKLAVPCQLRPYNVLKDTINYLLVDVMKKTHVPETVVYDFLNDRLRAVRQDMIIQRLPPKQCLELLDPIIRFHVYFAYRFSEKSIQEFDPVLNNKYLQECVKRFLNYADEMDRMKDYALLNLDFLNLGENKSGYDRVLIESLYILCNIESSHPLLRYLELPNDVKSNPQLKLSYEIAKFHLKGNYIRVCQLSHGLCPLTTCAFLVYLPKLQRRCLQIMSSAYNSKHLTVPVKVLQEWLLFNNQSDVIESCKHYGLTEDGGIKFNKAAFKCDVNELKPKLNNDLTENIILLNQYYNTKFKWCAEPQVGML